MKISRSIVSSCMALLLILAGCGQETDTVEVTSSSDGMTLVLELQDTIGVELGDSSYIFGSIEGLGYTPYGDIAVLDRISADIRLYTPKGDFIRSIGGRGGGPGEMHNPSGLFIFPDGRLGALDPWRTGLQLFTHDGEYLGNGMEVSHNVHLFPEIVSDSSFISLKTEFIVDEGSAPILAVFVALFKMSADPEVTYWREEMELDLESGADLAQKYLLSVSFAVDTLNGIVYVSPYSGADYRIDRFTIEGDQLSSLEMEIETVPLTEEEMRVEEAYISQKLSSMEGGDPMYNVHLSDPITHRLPVTDLEIDPQGNLWARRGTEDEPMFDIWSPQCELIGKAMMAGVGPDSRSWEFEICSEGILAYDTDPDYCQRILLVGIQGQPYSGTWPNM